MGVSTGPLRRPNQYVPGSESIQQEKAGNSWRNGINPNPPLPNLFRNRPRQAHNAMLCTSIRAQPGPPPDACLTRYVDDTAAPRHHPHPHPHLLPDTEHGTGWVHGKHALPQVIGDI
jgi:hypothetical protein